MTGGLPEAVAASINKQSILKIRMIHEKILSTYKEQLLSLPNLIDITKANEILNILPYQLLKPNNSEGNSE